MAKLTDKNTKAEILAAYHQLAEEKKSPPTGTENIPKQVSPTVKVVQTESKATMNAGISQDKVNSTIASLDSLQLGFGAVTSQLSEQLTTEAAKLAEIREAVTAEIMELQALHGLSVDEDTFAQLIESYKTNSKAFGEELRAREEAYQQEVQSLTKPWQKEQEQHGITVKERVELDQKNNQREVQEYKYNWDLARKIDQEQFEQQQANLYYELLDAKEAQEKACAAKEVTVAEREDFFYKIKDQVAAFAQEKEKAIEKAKAEGKGIATWQAKIKSDLYGKEVAGQQRFYDGRIQSLEDSISNQGDRLNSLSKQLEAALKQVQDLAVKAIEGSANANSYQTLKEITLEQAKSQAKTN